MLSESVLVDTGAFAALFDPRDQYHSSCKSAAKELPIGKTYTCWPVITEATYLLRRYPEQRDSLLQAIYAGEFQILAIYRDELPALQDIFDKYHDQDVDLADAVLVHLADRENIDVVFTVDRRHFGVFHQKKGKAFHLLPEVL